MREIGFARRHLLAKRLRLLRTLRGWSQETLAKQAGLHSTALHFAVADEVYKALPKTAERRRWHRDVDASDGYAVVALDERGVGTFRRIHANQPVAAGEILMRYRVRSGRVKFATNAFFFQEGHAKLYEPARYGQFRVDDAGGLLLAAMFDKDLNRLGPGERRP